jgi:aspartyl-tRNA(Asn)/glutamyl-tRNA(Gln) amidotransferase subunit C
VAVTHDDVRAVAALARLAVSEGRLDALVEELNGILGHMEVLARVESGGAVDTTMQDAPGMRLARDEPPSVPLTKPPSEFAPQWRDDFFLVPRLATHDQAGGDGEEHE